MIGLDGCRFDKLVRDLQLGSISRRYLLRGLAAGALGGMPRLLTPADDVAAGKRCRRVDANCTRNGQCCSGVCGNFTGYPSSCRRRTCHGLGEECDHRLGGSDCCEGFCSLASGGHCAQP
jgi:hypothetical protein